MTPPSTILIESQAPDTTAIGTGFIIHQADGYAYILTCAHVVRDVGGPEQVRAAALPAEVVALGEHNGLDLAVLRVSGLQSRAPFRLCPEATAGMPVQIEGYYKYVAYRALETLDGRLGKAFQLSDTRQEHFAQAWYIMIDDREKLVGGYSGSPVCDADSGDVVGVVITRDGDQQGRALTIAALPIIWPGMPEGLLAAPAGRAPRGRPASAAATPASPPAPQVPVTPPPAGPPAPQGSDTAAEAEQIRELIKVLRRRLQLRELERARKGISTEPHVLMEIEDLGKEINSLEARQTVGDAASARGEASAPQPARLPAGDATDTRPPRPPDGDATAAQPARPPVVEVEILAHPAAVSAETADECLDWREHYAQGTPAEALWSSTLYPELVALKGRLRQRRATTLLLDSDTRLSAALAFGYAFRQTTSFTLRVNQYGDIWSTEGAAAATAPLSRPQTELLDPALCDVTVELSSARQDISADVGAWLDDHPRRIGRRIRLAVTAEKISGPEALAIARAVFQLMHDERRKPGPPHTIHLFAAMPKGLAVLLGWHLHTCGPVQFYEKVGDGYRSACLLEERW